MTAAVTAADGSRPRPPRLHVGCGPVRLDGWINVDIDAHPAVDLVLDARVPLPFPDGAFELVFAEHFLEHLDREDGARFLGECRRLLRPGGSLRVSTPNLDWVWRTHYRFPADDDTKRAGALHLNQAFHGWGHHFLYNDVVLRDALLAVGFGDIAFFRYGESDQPALRGVERHEVNPFGVTDDCPDVIIAQGRRPAR